ncbi:N-acetylmuramoyl-L-alanine amidase family protein [Desulforamulus ruminis]|uniref:Cell wall hydrolase/autolysin n=1 Tax=Desulforamulus ruminis (strain ATCC 23193 / DSM 2154 / NCIMB 8452 / DL) TaxID=696281 RepID=F6DVJ0_DESRL|nr:N-acetylmuramoyl-L-alanine amidase [Desulforamulus ruminis]AEG61450.1 cell wall hydrolase/autolysin [Desulforamulus ruminis DSM 2154]
MGLRVIVVLILLLFPGQCWAESQPGRIVIDPGHGGYDPGAIRQGVAEKQINLEISKEIIKILRKEKVEVMLTRYGDYNHAILGLHGKEAKRYDFNRRIDMAKEFGADAMVSIHVNVSRERCSGPEAFFYKNSTKSKLLAQCIQKELHQIPEVRQRSIKTGSYYLLIHTNMPCVIVETGFINNPGERAKLLDQQYQQKIAAAISRGIVDYLKKKETSPPEDVKVMDKIKTFLQIQ